MILLSADIFQHCFFHFQNILTEITSVSNSLDPNQAIYSVKRDLGPNCLNRLSSEHFQPSFHLVVNG